MSLLLKNAIPEFADELELLLTEEGLPDLAQQVPGLRIVERCGCGDEFCATFYTKPKPNGAYGSGHENLMLEPEHGMIIVDVVNGAIACVEVLYRDDVGRKLAELMPQNR